MLGVEFMNEDDEFLPRCELCAVRKLRAQIAEGWLLRLWQDIFGPVATDDVEVAPDGAEDAHLADASL